MFVHTRNIALLVMLHCLPVHWCMDGTSAVPPREPLRIIAAPLFGISPAMDIMGVMAQLHSRGHEVLVVASQADTPFLQAAAARHSSNTSAESMQFVGVDLLVQEAGPAPAAGSGSGSSSGSTSSEKEASDARSKVTHNRFAVPRFPRALTAGMELALVIQNEVARPCAALVANATLVQRLRRFRADAVVSIGIPVPDTATDSCGCLLSHALGVPMIDIDCGMTFWSGPLSVPQFGTGLICASLSTWTGYTLNLLAWIIKQVARPMLSGLVPTAWSVARHHLGLPCTASGSVVTDAWNAVKCSREVKKCDVLLDVILGSWLLEYPRPLAPNQVLVGPGSPRPAHAITDPQVTDFVEGATSGLVLVGVGTSYQFNRWLKAEDYRELSKAFAALAPVRVLWHLKTQVLPQGVASEDLPLGSNTMVMPWVDYNDVLGHPNARLFFSHCGLHSLYEAAYHGVPLVGAPFMFEQAESCARLEATGAAVICRQAPAFRTGAAGSKVHYTSEHVAGLLREVMNNQSYTNAAQALSQYFKILAKRRHPYDSAADEIELAINTRRTQVAQHTRHLHATPPAAAENGQHMQRTPTSSAEPAVPQEGGASGAHEAEM